MAVESSLDQGHCCILAVFEYFQNERSGQCAKRAQAPFKARVTQPCLLRIVDDQTLVKEDEDVPVGEDHHLNKPFGDFQPGETGHELGKGG